MTDKQFETFLALLAIKLQDAIDESIDLLPPEASIEGKNILGEPIIYRPAMDPFRDLRNFIEKSAKGSD